MRMDWVACRMGSCEDEIRAQVRAGLERVNLPLRHADGGTMLTKYIVLVAKTGEPPRVWNEFSTMREADKSARNRHPDGDSEWDYVAVYERKSLWRTKTTGLSWRAL